MQELTGVSRCINLNLHSKDVVAFGLPEELGVAGVILDWEEDLRLVLVVQGFISL